MCMVAWRRSPVFALLIGLALTGAASAAPADPGTAALAALIRPMLAPAGDDNPIGAWEALEANRAVRWGAGPIMTDKPSPDGNYFARPGQANLAGRSVFVAATGARAGVFSVYIRDTAASVGAAVSRI